MAEGGEVVADAQSLQALFKEGWNAQKKIESDELSPGSDDYKVISLLQS